MGKLEKLNENIESLRRHLNVLIEKNVNDTELLLVSQQLDKLIVEYYSIITKKSAN
ncbi:MAG: aspartyl-phosphate phosphatase Spo0E family protein [Caldicoprobacterales bacterium]|jgi:hypothetical protein|nr:aspartyl-phosphate phosphatase Spo0E family protein [Clostridiales bacterium]